MLKCNQGVTEAQIKQAVAIVLKSAPERPGGGGRKITDQMDPDLDQ